MNKNEETTPLTQEQKIDYIFTAIKRQERNAKIARRVKIIMWVFIIGYIYYVLMILLPSIISGIIPDMSSFPHMPSTENMGIDSFKNFLNN